ncbi:TrmH family RNA methyltransferase [Mucilaginibacter myungsuensis]|uniref:RNA methyltransferase n=1 Tax=Mucilaginibacter myungsuensis TaxID=649104 RepID=A0A929PY19_9SPHI|nr:RNA methyltransferase [Mucilaginibacter myungsuensis]MBE9662872.1 RNA methyltransferase [Mucilaginibacter myungsuensis]MDN3598292.1 RNA methyltransferase [Mucilaginibacter myungsuensis]
MPSKSQISLIKSLQHKKFRNVHGLFIAEGLKSVAEFITSGYTVQTIYHTANVAPKLLKLSAKINFQEVSLDDIAKISNLTTPQEVIALIKTPQWPTLNAGLLKNKFALALDGIQDPGNMGTIIRTADWFGIKHIICSEDSVDVYNPKVVQATMGSLARMNVYYTDLEAIIPQLSVPVYGALFNGQDIYQTPFKTEGLVVMGNEGNGIRPNIERLIKTPVTIPGAGNTESLNVAIATAIFCSEIFRDRS